MVEKIRITAHICAIEPEASYPIEFDSMSNAADAISTDESEIIAKLIKKIASCTVPINDQMVGVIVPTSIPVDCEADCSYMDGVPDEAIQLVWEEDDTYPVVHVFNPDHCHWFLSILAAVAPPCDPDGCELLIIHVDAPGEIPIPTDQELVHSGGGWTDWIINQNQIAPGMRFSLMAYFSNGLTITPIEIDFMWYCTCCMTGGTILSINGTYGDSDISYNVDVMGETKTAYPSDWVQWEVGDWVHLIPRPPGNKCGDSSRAEKIDFLCACNIVDSYTIVPTKVNNFGD